MIYRDNEINVDLKIPESPVNASVTLPAIEEANSDRIKSLKLIQQKHPDKCFSNCDYAGQMYVQPQYIMFNPDFPINPKLVKALDETKYEPKQCDGKIQTFYGIFTLLRDVTITPGMWDHESLSEAGKELYQFKSHGQRNDSAEVLKPTKGLLRLKCTSNQAIVFNNTTLKNVPLLRYLTVSREQTKIDKTNTGTSRNNQMIDKQTSTVAIIRADYANFYHMMLHMHDIFTMLMLLHHQPVNVSILIFDAHPQAEVDEILKTLYGPVIRVTKLLKPVHYNNLVLSMQEYNSLLSKYWLDSLPHLEDFRTFFYNQHMLHEHHYQECKKLTITFLWRRDKIWHPRNLRGLVHRKIFNEAEIFKAVYDKYPHFCINGLLLESMPIQEQLKFIRRTDILIGMHGAGLTHTLFLPHNAGLVELFPQGFRQLFKHHKLFEAIARWRNLHYLYYENTNGENEMPNYFTRIETEPFLKLVDSMVTKLCQGNK